MDSSCEFESPSGPENRDYIEKRRRINYSPESVTIAKKSALIKYFDNQTVNIDLDDSRDIRDQRLSINNDMTLSQPPTNNKHTINPHQVTHKSVMYRRASKLKTISNSIKSTK